MVEVTNKAGHPDPKANRIGRARADYEGSKSTLCIGCGHDLITRHITDALWMSGIEPHRVGKMSGIGCSSKTPAYFLGKSWGFNGVHGRMPAITTGASLANHKLLYIGVSGDGDTASIGMGHFVHMVRRNPQCVYVIENNGVYGLTKGQFSATAEKGAKIKSGDVNPLNSIDLCALAVELGCGFVARGFAGNMKQMQALFQAAAAYPGLAVLDVVSPCVTFNNFDSSRFGFANMKEHEVVVNELGFVPSVEYIEENIEPGEVKDVEFPDGSHLRIRALARGHDPSNRMAALALLHETYEQGEVLTGMFYVDPTKPAFSKVCNLPDNALSSLQQDVLRPSAATLDTIMERYTS